MQIVDEIPLLLTSIYLFRWFDSWPFGHLFLDLHAVCQHSRRERQSLVGYSIIQPYTPRQREGVDLPS